ncbi:uncharacterized protein LOC143856635 [Tasmannia lanceolata]|uniref:uncharacterized protein LOC143856635 n=1 Tax=Tasmannia lanceolata TaxID=3420 RepID=UPI004062FAB2
MLHKLYHRCCDGLGHREHLVRTWKLKGEFQIYNLHRGFFLFKFNNNEDCDTILEGSNYFFVGRPLILRRWEPGMAIEKLNLSTVPIWMRFPELNLSFWSAHCLSKIASKIGHPLYMDVQTTEASWLSYALVCIEVEAGIDLPNQIDIRTYLGVTHQKVEYEWRPSSCKECKSFSHASSSCLKKQAKENVKKE